MSCPPLSLFHPSGIFLLTISFPRRLEDEEALRAKVDEALSVYDEYMKNKGAEGEQTGEAAKPKEAAKETSTEENKS